MKHKPKKNPNYRHRSLDDGDDDLAFVDKKTSHRRERREFNPQRIKSVWEELEEKRAKEEEDRRLQEEADAEDFMENVDKF